MGWEPVEIGKVRGQVEDDVRARSIEGGGWGVSRK